MSPYRQSEPKAPPVAFRDTTPKYRLLPPLNADERRLEFAYTLAHVIVWSALYVVYYFAHH